MPDTNAQLLSFNAGEVSPLALGRIDLAKLRVAAEVQRNFLPHVLGPMMLRPGTQFIAEVPSDDPGWFGEFYFDETTKALLVATVTGLRFLIDDAWLTRVAVSTAITNGTFAGDISGWTNSDESGATSAYAAVDLMSLLGTGSNYAYRDQQVTVSGGDAGKEHAVRLTVYRGYVSLAIGTSQGDDSYWSLVGLPPGTYSLAFTPSGDFWIRLGASTAYPSLVQSIVIESAGVVALPIPWAAADFGLIRYDQSGDVVFTAAASTSNQIGYQQRRIERRAPDSRSWAIAKYVSDDGPFRLANTGPTQITASDVTGNVTLTSDKPLFKAGHVGALFQLVFSFQTAQATLGGANQFTAPIRVAGLSSHQGSISSRNFSITITGTFSATVTLQRSIGAPGSWSDVKSWTADTAEGFDDALDNQIIYYRLGIKTGAYASGSAVATLAYGGSQQTGVARITDVASSTSASADVLATLGQATTYTSNWAEGEWSDYRGWPAAVSLHDGRLAWGGGINLDGSVSDAYASFDPTVIGDSGPIDRTIATGGQDGIRALLSLQRLIAFTATQEVSIRASSLDEPLTPTQFVARDAATRGAAKVRPLKIDQQGIYVGRNGQRIYQLRWNPQANYADYSSEELTRLHQEVAAAGVVDCAVQRQPDTRLWYPVGDGSAPVLTYDMQDEVVAWTPVSSPNGIIERVASLPGNSEDDVYLLVRRTILGVTKRYIEKLAHRTECVGGTLNKTMDCHTVYSGAATNTINVPQLASQPVVVWADGKPLVTQAAPITVSAIGVATLPGGYLASNAVIGLAYTGQFQSAKLAYGAGKGSALTQQKRVDHIGLVLANTGWKGVRIGRDFDHMTGLPATYHGRPLDPLEVLPEWDDTPGPFNGGWDADSRVCLTAESPYPCTVVAMALSMTTEDGSEDNAPHG